MRNPTPKFYVRTTALSAVVLFVCASAFAGDSLLEQVWGRYLRPSEWEALAAMRNTPQDNPPENADPAALLAGARQGFEKMVQELGPPLPGQTAEPYSQGDVSGLWIRPGDADGDRVLLYLHGEGAERALDEAAEFLERALDGTLLSEK